MGSLKVILATSAMPQPPHQTIPMPPLNAASVCLHLMDQAYLRQTRLQPHRRPKTPARVVPAALPNGGTRQVASLCREGGFLGELGRALPGKVAAADELALAAGGAVLAARAAG
jgi:hypothetical protein